MVRLLCWLSRIRGVVVTGNKRGTPFKMQQNQHGEHEPPLGLNFSSPTRMQVQMTLVGLASPMKRLTCCCTCNCKMQCVDPILRTGWWFVGGCRSLSGSCFRLTKL